MRPIVDADWTRSLPAEMVMDDGLFLQIFLEQKQVRVLGLPILGVDVQRLLRSPAFPRSSLSSIKSLCVPDKITSIRDLEGYRQMIELATSLEGLTVLTHEVLSDDGDERESLQEKRTWRARFSRLSSATSYSRVTTRA